MSNIIERVKIEKLFGEKDVDWNLRPDVNVLVGKNGLGKSTILKIIEESVSSYDDVRDIFNFYKRTYVYFFNNNERNLRVGIYDKYSLIDYSKKMFTNESFWKGFEEFLINNKTEQDLQTFQKLSQNMDDFEISFIEHIKNTSFDRVSKNITDRFTSKILPTETISTINMSANSINQITTSSGQHGTLLDFEIENELQRLLKLQNSSLENNVIEALNNFFNETNKTVKINNQELKVYLTPEREISFKHLSSGERQVIYIFLKVANATKDNALILMDEPEISLHLAWQEKLISEIRKVNDKSQLIIVTHSPAIVMNGWMDSFIDINDIFVGE
ncbi:AAA family ATPase [Moraxella osloensis]|jgi:predicted ATPase|uniref:AAA family ATPase n=1 Tax=Faucicola osloensis TaxID=34062 RepID=A0A6P1KDN1_FAUOS|nr:ATP-binding protein [Moraxella osloensis]QHG10259.1 AAA family ATPase [Moraxella osloensis]